MGAYVFLVIFSLVVSCYISRILTVHWLVTCLTHKEKISFFSFNVVAITQRILRGRPEIRHLSSSVEKYFSSERSEGVKYFATQ